ncbi:MAG TPA: ferritin-like domain-containing protein [Thermoanaerobaculia bacterium]|nr:ferritin-like domain-containing protein [Thermoanaerobaculia bacterium]
MRDDRTPAVPRGTRPGWIGSDEHKQAFCRSFVETHRPFRPEDIVWPELDPEALLRLSAMPIWNEAVRTEAETALKVQTLGRVEPDPILAEAIALQGYEEGRHAEILRLLTAQYGIAVEPFDAPRPPRNPVWEFVSTGYGECIDSFFAFGLFAIGRRSQYFPEPFIDIFDPIMQEEARHILFVVNWVAYLRARAPWATRPLFDARRIWTLGAQLVEHARHALRVGTGGGESQEGFTMTSAAAFEDLSARSFLEVCLSENDRRLALYDPRLLRPRLVPAAARFALKFIPNSSSGNPKAEAPARPPSPPPADRSTAWPS